MQPEVLYKGLAMIRYYRHIAKEFQFRSLAFARPHDFAPHEMRKNLRYHFFPYGMNTRVIFILVENKSNDLSTIISFNCVCNVTRFLFTCCYGLWDCVNNS